MHAPHPAASAAAPVAVRVAGAVLGHGGAPLFDGLSATFAAGRWTCLLGLSGAGKSSLLRLLAGLAPLPAADTVTAGDGGALAGRLAWMDQRDLLLPWCSAEDNVVLGARLRGAPASRARARALLEAVGLAGSGHLLPAALSGGMRQRVALARTLMEDRPVVLMDEPFSAVDALTRLRLQELAARLLAGRTVVLVTHDPWEALRLGHRIHVLAGRPAHLGEAVEPPGDPPRGPADPALAALYGDLLARLGAVP